MNKKYTPELEKFMKKNNLGINRVREEERAQVCAPTTRFKRLKKTKLWPHIYKYAIVYANMRRIYHKLRYEGFFKTFRELKNKKKKNRDYIRSLFPSKDVRLAQRKHKFSKKVKFSVLAPLYNTPEKYLKDMINSVIAQTYPNWELCLVDGSDDKHSYVGDIVKQYQKKDKRIIYKKLEKNLGISENTNACIDMATGNYIALFDHDDILVPTALYDNMVRICDEDADFLYSDEATFNDDDIYDIVTYHFKPDFAIDNLRSNNYICHFSVFKKSLIDEVGKFSTKYDGSQDHDMILRLSAAAKNVCHIPKLLYLWRSHSNSVAKDINSKTYAIDAGKRAVTDSLTRAGLKATVESSPAFPTIYKINYEIIGKPKISIIIPNKDNLKILANCIDSILKLSTYDNFEILIVENNSVSDEIFEYYKLIEKMDMIKVIKYEGGFNYSRINNFAVDHAEGDYILFLNNDIEIIAPAWMEELLMYAQREDIGAVGAKLYYGNNVVQHNGVILGTGEDGIATHSLVGESRTSVGYMGRLYFAQNLSAVTAACMMMKKAVFKELGGFDEKLAVAYNDVDLCIRIREKGLLIVCNPFADAYHYESISRGYEQEKKNQERFRSEVAYMKKKWQPVLEKGDPFYNPNLSKNVSWKFDVMP